MSEAVDSKISIAIAQPEIDDLHITFGGDVITYLVIHPITRSSDQMIGKCYLMCVRPGTRVSKYNPGDDALGC